MVATMLPGAVWTAPTFRAEIAYRGWTANGELRQASFKGLRDE
jgi:bifunctional non-homologous end joining protein LigD